MAEYLPIACSLPLRQAADQVYEWADLQRDIVASERVDGGYRVTYAAHRAEEVEDLVQREGACCSWLDLSTEVGADGITVRLRSSNPDALPVIEMLAFGT